MASARQKVSEVKPYLERALNDDQIRENVRNAFFAAREVYDELLGDRGASALATKIAQDDEIRKNLKKAVDELRHAADRVQGKARHTGRNTLLLLSGVAIGVLFNPVTGPTTRRWLKKLVAAGERHESSEPSFDSDGHH